MASKGEHPGSGKQKQGKPPRRDPKPRLVDTSFSMNVLVNRQPGVHYCYVQKGDQVPMMELKGYKVQRFTKDGVRPQCVPGAFKEGEPIEVNGAVLLAISKEDYDQLFFYGQGGASGQDLLDELEKQIMDPETSARDQLHTVRGYRKFGVTNETTLEIEG
jgi:hypothetical protein